MLPSAEKFASRMRKLGIGDGKKVIAYDTVGLFSAARAWWMFRIFGHDDVAVLDGGFPKWQAEGRPIDEDPPGRPQERHFSARFQSMMVRDRNDILGAVKTGKAQIADARSPGRFTGAEPEPRPGIRSGHMPGAANVHYATLLEPDGTLKSPEEIAKVFAAAGVDVKKPVITSCGSGITAAILSLGLTLIGARDHALYDGSWSEWGAASDTPVETGAIKS
jgi:thiosulfate/3-mercaptopyruvate sulfurtransferase